MATNTITDEHKGKKVQFKSKSTKDTTTWKGTVEATATYSVAKLFGDLLAYNRAVQKTDSLVGEVDTLDYFLIILDNNSGTSQIVAFANEWIQEGTLDIIEEDVNVNIIVYDTSTADHSNILTVLREAGYKAVIKSIE